MKKSFQARLIDGDVQIESDIFKDRIQRQDLIKNHFGLNAVPTTPPDESLLIRGFATVLHQTDADIIVQHPLTPLKLIVNQTVGARNGYFICCGDYQQQMLDMIHQYVAKEDKALEVGAGLGVTTSYLGLQTEKPVVTIEPQEKLHEVIYKNTNLNNVDVQIIHGAITPDSSDDYSEFHIMQDYLKSSIFKKTGTVDVSIKVPQISLEKAIHHTNANTLVFDIVGAEISLIYDENIKSFNKVICALNTPIIGEEKTAHIINHLTKNGFELKNIRGLIFVFTKK